MDTIKNRHSRMDEVIRNYYGNVRTGHSRRLHDIEKAIRGHYAPNDRRSAVLMNYYGQPHDIAKHHFHRLHHVLGNYYGQMDLYAPSHPSHKRQQSASPAPAGLTVSKSFDDGEILDQQPFQEYVVAKSMEEDPFQEYVVMSLSEAEEPFVEYIVTSASLSAGGGATSDSDTSPASPVDLDAYDKQVLKELNIDISNPLAQAKSWSNTTDTTAGADPGAPATPAPGKTPAADDFLADLQMIMSTPAPQQKQPSSPAAAPALPPSEHAIFDRIAKSMQYANAYDLGTVELDNRFADFDKFYDQKEKMIAPATQPASSVLPQPPPTSDAMDVPDPMEMIKDLDSIFNGKGSGGAGGGTQNQAFGGITDAFFSLSDPQPNNPAWPPKPANIRQYTSAERAAKFTDFSYLPDPGTYNGDGIKILNDWDKQNIVAVDIPQLSQLHHGKMQFHRLGATQLQDLWKAWEDAGLLNRIVSFDGSYATRYIRHTENRSPRPLSNHAWGTAFDINAALNPYGSEPALVGQPGCVRELVEIAGQHGFYWGGFFSPHKDGMHFELGKIIS